MPHESEKNHSKNWLAIVAVSLMVPVIANALLVWRTQALHARDLQSLADDIEAATKHDATVTRFWRLHSWERTRINELRVKHRLGVAEWPDLTVDETQ